MTNNIKVLLMRFNRLPANQVKKQDLSFINLTDEEMDFINSIKSSKTFLEYIQAKTSKDEEGI